MDNIYFKKLLGDFPVSSLIMHNNKKEKKNQDKARILYPIKAQFC